MRYLRTPLQISLALLVGSGVLVTTFDSTAVADHDICVHAETVVTFDRVYTGSYRSGEPYDYLTIQPDGGGETLEEAGISIRVRLHCDERGFSYVGVPPNEVVLWNYDLNLCQSKWADSPTDADGWTSFSGTLSGGGCAEGLVLFADGIPVATLPININSPDTGLATPGFTDSADLAAFANVLGNPNAWDICFDYNKSGPPTIDSGDLAYFAATLGAACN